MKDSDIFVCKEKSDNGGVNEEEYPVFGLVDQVRINLFINQFERFHPCLVSNIHSSNKCVVLEHYNLNCF